MDTTHTIEPVSGAVSANPWFVDLHGSINADHDIAKREEFYKKIIAIGEAIQSRLQQALAAASASQSAAATLSKTERLRLPTSALVDVAPSTAAVKALQGARKEVDGAKEIARRRRRQIESSLDAVPAHRPHGKQKKHAEDVQGTAAEIDIDGVLSRAHILVPPVSGFFAQKRPSSESFDENDYYSSRAASPASAIGQDDQSVSPRNAGNALSEVLVSEDEFEPALEPASSLRNLLPSFQDDADAAYEPALASDEGDDEYEPPNPESPPYEPRQAETSVRQPVNPLTGELLPPRAIAINHIQSPIAPQPSHVSPVANAMFAQQLDHSAAEQSSRSEQEIVLFQGKKGKNKIKTTNSNKQKGTSKKRKRVEEVDPRSANKRRSHGDATPFIKQEPESPPPLQTTGPRLNIAADPAATTFNIPAGYKLVPIHTDERSHREQIGHGTTVEATRQRQVPLLRDSRGVEYYAYAEPLGLQQPGSAYSQGVPHEAFAQHAPSMHRIARDVGYSAMAPRATPRPYVHALYHEQETPRLRVLDNVASSIPGRYAGVPYQLESRHGPSSHTTSENHFLDGHVQEAPYRGGMYSAMGPPAGYEPSRAHSTHPQAFMGTHHHNSAAVTPLHAPVPMHARAASVYAPSEQQQPPPMTVFQGRHW